MGLAAGDLNRQVLIEARAAGKDALNQPNGAWGTFATLWCAVRGSTGMGVIKGGLDVPVSAYSLRIRYNTSITDAMRVNLGGKIMDIIEVRHDLANKDWTDLVCRAGGNNG